MAKFTLMRWFPLTVARSPAPCKELVLPLPAAILVFVAAACAGQAPAFTSSPRPAAGQVAGTTNLLQVTPFSLASQIEDALAKGDSNAARKLVSQLLMESRLPAETLLRTGASLAEHDLYPEATKVFERCVRDFPQVFEGYYNLALAELALREFPGALATLAKAPPTTPSGEVARTYLRGKIEAALGKNAAAEKDLAASVQAAPGEENYALDLGLFYLQSYNYQAALAVFQKATRFQKNSPFLQLGLGLSQFLAGHELEAVETCRALLAMQPDFSTARLLMGFALYVQGNIEEAERTADQGLRGPNPSVYLLYLDAVCLLKLQSQNYARMTNDLTTAARAIPRCSLCYLALSKAHQRKGEQSNAKADLERAIGIDPNLAEAWYRLASLYEQAGQGEAAAQARRRFEELKGKKVNQETEMLRDAFVKSLGGESPP